MALTIEQRIARLEAQLAERDAENNELHAQNDELRAQNDELRQKLEAALARIADLEAKVNQNSSNSSRPPSSDPPWTSRPKTKRKTKSKRRRGAQKGHKGHRRALLPPEKLRYVYDVHPEHCNGCGSSNLIDDGSEPVRHQVTDLPPVEPFTDEWRQYLGLCLDCGAATRASLPVGVPRSNFGPVLTALVALLTAVYKVSKRGVHELLRDVFNISMSLGAVSNCERNVSESLAAPFEQAWKYVQTQTIAHADETSWKEMARKMWLWVMATPAVSVFFILPGRTGRCARYVLGRFNGILISDRFKSYLFYPMGNRQICWSHLLRDFVALSERDGIDGDFGGELVELTMQMFQWWHQVRDGPMSRSTFRRKMKTVKEQIEELLDWGFEIGVQWRRFEDILKHREALWTFMHIDGVEPTNNHAEQQVRHAVLLRKVSLGTQSVRGSLFIERMMTAVATLRKQGRNVHSFLVEACRAHVAGTKPPSLLPDHVIDEAA